MVGRELESDKDAAKECVFLEFNAWLYKGSTMLPNHFYKPYQTDSSELPRTASPLGSTYRGKGQSPN
jgi:hypothetical protein